MRSPLAVVAALAAVTAARTPRPNHQTDQLVPYRDLIWQHRATLQQVVQIRP